MGNGRTSAAAVNMWAGLLDPGRHTDLPWFPRSSDHQNKAPPSRSSRSDEGPGRRALAQPSDMFDSTPPRGGRSISYRPFDAGRGGLRPSTRLRLALRAARRRRYGYAALRVLRRGLARAVADHVARSIGAAPYASEIEAIRDLYRRGLSELLRRFGRLDLSDERARP